ncbi:MAG: type II toxin-antitoxin system ParD family antitoxin [Aliidongia sp.]
MPTRNVVLTERQEALIEALVQSGRYQNASEVLRDGLRMVEDREVEEARKLEALRAAVQVGELALERGEYKDFSGRVGDDRLPRQARRRGRRSVRAQMTGVRWGIRLGAVAEADFARILEYTSDTFGQRQSDLYRNLIQEALAALAAGPEVPGSIARDDIRPGLCSLHVARRGRRGRHLIIYRTAPGNLILVLRILHDSMDFPRHAPLDEG